MTRGTMRTLIATAILIFAFGQAAAAAEILYYLSPAPPPAERREMKDLEGERRVVAAEPVARISSDDVKQAKIVREEAESLDDDEPVTQVYRVFLVLDEGALAKVTAKMDELCKTREGVHIVVDDTVIDYRPFAVCGKFEASVAFPNQEAADQFAHKFAKDVTVVTTPKG